MDKPAPQGDIKTKPTTVLRLSNAAKRKRGMYVPDYVDTLPRDWWNKVPVGDESVTPPGGLTQEDREGAAPLPPESTDFCNQDHKEPNQ